MARANAVSEDGSTAFMKISCEKHIEFDQFTTIFH